MPYRIIWENGGLVYRFSGGVSDEDLVGATEEVNAHPLFAAMSYQIVDFSVIDTFDASSVGVRRVASMDRLASETNPDVRVAIITSATFIRGMSRMYALGHGSEGGSWTTEVFESEEDARAWAISASA